MQKSSFPRVTISIPTYNQEKFIRKAIESALAQDYAHIEINISDDCSKDSTLEICREYRKFSNVHIYHNEKNLGRVGNYKKLLYEHATGEWVLNLDGDDCLTSTDFITRAIAMIRGNKNIVLYHANFFDIVKLRRYFKKSLSKNCKLVSGIDYVLNRCFVHYFFHLSALYNRQAAIRSRFYSYDCLNTDALSLRTLALYGDVILDAEKVGEWQLTEQSETRKNASDIEIAKVKKANEQYLDFLRSSLSQQDFDLYLRNNKRAERQTNLYKAIHIRDLVQARKLLLRDFTINEFYLRQLGKFILCKLGII